MTSIWILGILLVLLVVVLSRKRRHPFTDGIGSTDRDWSTLPRQYLDLLHGLLPAPADAREFVRLCERASVYDQTIVFWSKQGGKAPFGDGTPVVEREHLGHTMLGATITGLRNAGLRIQEHDADSVEALHCMRYAVRLGGDDIELFVELSELEARHGHSEESAAVARIARQMLPETQAQAGDALSDSEGELRRRLSQLEP